jgi:uncharacterized protein DUF6491
MRSLVLALVALIAAVTGPALAQPAEAPKSASCFFVTDFDTWRPRDTRTLIIRVRTSNYYRLDLAQECPAATWPGAHLIMNVRGPNTICTALDWDLRVSTNPNGMITPCIVKTMTLMTPAEVAALPKGAKP